MTSELVAAARPSRAGECIDSRYRLEAEIGAGGLGSVYRATQTKLARPVAVKLLHESWGASDVQRGRFEREAKALASLEHPNIVAVLDYGVADDQPYLVMELLEGETLSQRLKKGSLPLETALSIARQLLESLAFMHGAGLVHRDLKPSNVFLQRTQSAERVKVLDFGLAKSTLTGASADATLTRDGTVVGTPAYMSPEQATGDNVDARSDVYAVGVLLFQMLSGRLPFEGDAIEQVRSHLVAPVPALARARPVRELDAALEKLIWRAMAKRRDDRFPTADAMLSELVGIVRKHVHSGSHATDTDPESLPSDMLEPLDDSRSAALLALSVRARRALSVGARVFSVASMLLVIGSVAMLVMLLRSDDDRADLIALQQRVSQRMVKRVWSKAAAPSGGARAAAAVGGKVASADPAETSAGAAPTSLAAGPEPLAVSAPPAAVGGGSAQASSVATAGVAAPRALAAGAAPAAIAGERPAVAPANADPAHTASDSLRPAAANADPAHTASDNLRPAAANADPAHAASDSLRPAVAPANADPAHSAREAASAAAASGSAETATADAPARSPADPRAPGLPPSTNPWERPLPKELRALHKGIFAGMAGNDRTILALKAYGDAHPEDVRGHLLLSQLFMNRYWRKDAVAQIAYALKLDLTARGAPEVLENLLAVTIHGRYAADSNRVIVRAFGSEALPQIDAHITSLQDPDAVARLRSLRARALPAMRP